jgi:hypothetical protein
LRSGADAVVVVACPPGGCRFRAGPMLLEQRFAARREPHLRPSVPRERLLVVHAARHERARVRAEIGRLLERLAELKPAAPNGSEPGHAHLAPKRRDARRNARRARAPGESAPARPAVAPLGARGPTTRVSSSLDPSESDHG